MTIGNRIAKDVLEWLDLNTDFNGWDDVIKDEVFEAIVHVCDDAIDEVLRRE